jgi:hypothetical protein
MLPEVMQKALDERKKREEEEKKAKEQKGESFDFGKVEYLALEDQKEKVFRLLGKPPELRTSPTDLKFVLQSSILRDDKGGYVKVNWKFIVKDGKIIPDPDWILTKLHKKVNEGQWQKYEDSHIDSKGKNGEWVHYHKDKEIFKRIAGNGKEGAPWPKKFYPSVRVVGNVIDRHDSWCQENKKCKLLTSKLSPFNFKDNKGEAKTIFFRDTGIPKAAYDAIFEHFTKINSYWENTDCILVKRAKTKDYVAWDKGDARYLSPESIGIAKDTDLTTEEKQYELNNLDLMYADTSYAKLKRYLSGLFKQADLELGETFYDQLTVLAEKEAAEKPKNSPKEENNDDSEENPETTSPSSDSPPLKSPTPPKEELKNILSKEELLPAFPHFDKLSAEDQQLLIQSVKEVTGTIPVYHDWVEDYYCFNKACKFVNTDITTSFPGKIFTCPVCGKVPEK